MRLGDVLPDGLLPEGLLPEELLPEDWFLLFELAKREPLDELCFPLGADRMELLPADNVLLSVLDEPLLLPGRPPPIPLRPESSLKLGLE